MKTKLAIIVLFNMLLIIHSQSTICEGTTRNYSVDDADGSSGTPNSSYTWSILEPNFEGTFSSPNGPNDTNDIDVNWDTTPIGTYTLQVIENNDDNCEGTPITHSVEVLALPDLPSISASSSTICPGSDSSFIISGPANSTVTYTLNGDSPISVNLNDQGIANIDLTGLESDAQLSITNITNGICSRTGITTLSSTITILSSPQTSAINAN